MSPLQEEMVICFWLPALPLCLYCCLVCYHRPELFFQERAVSLIALLLKNTGIEDLDPVKSMLLVQLPRNLLIKNLLILQHLFQDNLNCKISKPTKFLNKLLSYHQILYIFHRFLVLMLLDHLFGYEDFKSTVILYCLYINQISDNMMICDNSIDLLIRAILYNKDC